MTFQHWRTILWLRTRLALNQISRMGWGNRILLYVLIVLGILLGASSLITSAILGIWVLPRVWQEWIVLVTNGLAIAFLISWMIGVLNDLQRSEPLSLEKFLHLPISPRNVFFLNYASSFFSLSLIIFVPMMLSWSIVLAWKYGGLIWFAPFLTLAFFVMVTALTNQFRGWLASLMMNKRRRRTVVTLLTLGLVLASQIPNVLDRTLFRAREIENRKARAEEFASRDRLSRSLESGAISPDEYAREMNEVDQERSKRRSRQFADVMRWTRMANAYFPPFWVASGLDNASRNRWQFAALSLLGLLGISSVSLMRSYQTTLRLYRGGFESSRPRKPNEQPSNQVDVACPRAPQVNGGKPVEWTPNWLEKAVPGANTQQSTIFWLSCQNFARAPEAKLALVIPILIVALIGASLFFGRNQPLTPNLRPLIGVGVCFVAMIGVSQLLQNQFGFDGKGFRALMLAPVGERDILIGKNLSMAPVALTLGLLAIVLLQVFCPLTWSHFLATVVQLLNMYLVACLVGNLMSIVVPLRIAPGSLKPVNMKFAPVVLQILIFLLAPLGMVPALVPLAVEILFGDQPQWNWLPIYLLGVLIYLAVLGLIYVFSIGRQAKLLAARKWKILETVTDPSS